MLFYLLQVVHGVNTVHKVDGQSRTGPGRGVRRERGLRSAQSHACLHSLKYHVTVTKQAHSPSPAQVGLTVSPVVRVHRNIIVDHHWDVNMHTSSAMVGHDQHLLFTLTEPGEGVCV